MSLLDRLNLGDLFDPGREPDKTALIAADADGNARHFSYRTLERAITALSSDLARRGFRRGARVALLGINSAEYLVAYFAIMRAGLVAVPVNIRLPDGTIHFILGDAAAEFAFADRARLAALPSGLTTVPFDSIAIESAPDVRFTTVVPEGRDVAMILYTSGSTGRPKGVLLSHQGQLWALRTRLATYREPAAERFLVAAPLYHMNALFSAKTALMTRASLVLLAGFTPESYIDATVRFRCTVLTSVPTMIARVVKDEARLAAADLGSVGRVTMGSAPTTQALWDKARAAFPAARLTTGYGTTEHGPSTFGPHPDGLPTPDLALGYPLPGNEVRLSGGITPDKGVLEVRCPAVMEDTPICPRRPQRCCATAGTGPAMSCGAAATVSTSLSGGPTTCSSAPARTSIPARSRRCWSATRRCTRRASCRWPMRSAARSRSPLSCCVRARTPARPSSSNSRWGMRRRCSIRAAYSSSRNCR